VYIPSTQTKKHGYYPDFSNSFNAELAAIKQVLTLTYNQEWHEITIYTDCKSAIQAITNFKWTSSNYIPEIIQQINNFRSAGTKINLYWIPSHAGIRGNEIADQLANARRTADDGETLRHTPNTAEKLKMIKKISI
jgi:ribonuclease HI